MLGPLAVIESVRTRPVAPVAFAHAKIVHVMAGRSRVRTPAGERLLTAGDVMVLGRGVWCEAVPSPRVRAWTIYLDQEFMVRHMTWALPAEPERVLPGLHPAEWDGGAVFFRPGEEMLTRLEPLWRRMSVLPHRGGPDAAAGLMALFAQAVELTVPALLTVPSGPVPIISHAVSRLSQVPVVPEAERAAALLRADLSRAWTVGELARAVALSTSQLTRRFCEGYGVPPMRWLIEARTTEFARLIEETALPVDAVARQVGWADRRVAAAWFRRRFGVSPTRFRRHPAPVCAGESPCVLCRNGQCVRVVS
ncbi:helix-turn-helix transcriptional regulator [Microbacterium sp. JB110]|uniref:helix-turn-helix transcriptional regulator n=1 Tax=Microbacterium sp. JB110 TaxID=2024477 RepID=UPI001124B8AB|nr:AraC family transcriptional regulator [Microbacterium sp. JB110]